MCEFCEANKMKGNKFCMACGNEVNETMGNKQGCPACKETGCQYKERFGKNCSLHCDIEDCGQAMRRELFCPNCGQYTMMIVNHIP